MYVTLKETLTLDIFNEFELMTGEKGLRRPISRIGILDHEMINPIEGQFVEGEFALSTLLAAKDHPELIYSSVKYLIDSKASGLGIKNIYFSELPEEVISLAEAADFPIFIFNNSVYFEDIITEFKSFMDKLAYEATMNLSIEKLLGELDLQACKTLYYELIGGYDGEYVVLCVRHKGRPDALSSIHLSSHKLLKDLSVLFSGVFNESIFLVLKYSTKEAITRLLEMEKLSFERHYFYGVSRSYKASEHLKVAFEEALTNARIADVENLASCAYDDRGLYAFILPYKNQAISEAYRCQHLEPLMDYDKTNGGTLFETVMQFVKNEGSVKATAASMNQHSNTIRYRMSKVRSLLNITGSDSVLYERLSLAVKLHLIHEINY